jgi:hypothetical protein
MDSPSDLTGGDGGGSSRDMERRVAALEADMKSLIKDVAEIKGRVLNMPTTWQLFGLNVALVALVATIYAGAAVVWRSVEPG